MSRYSRMFLHFLHAITNDRDRVHTFVFGTRLTNITRHLRHRDVDVALTGSQRRPWRTGRAGRASAPACAEFNLRWSRRAARPERGGAADHATGWTATAATI